LKIFNLGKRTIPHIAKRHLEKFETGAYMSLEFFYPAHKINSFRSSVNRNTTVIRATISKVAEFPGMTSMKEKSKEVIKCIEKSSKLRNILAVEEVMISDLEAESIFKKFI
jgi:ribosomal protein S6